MKALSIKPPWAYYIIYGLSLLDKVTSKVILKDIENRNWPLPKSFHIPQRIQIHVSKQDDDTFAVMNFCVGKLGLPLLAVMQSFSNLLPRGAIIGEVDITGCVEKSESPWFVGKYGFVLAHPKVYTKPIPYRGQLRFFESYVNEEQ